MNDLKYVHALRYAFNAAKLRMMELFKEKYPYLFAHAYMEFDSVGPEDFYLPPGLKTLVVRRTYFDETGCRRFACFPFKDDWRECGENQPTVWVLVGERHELACQPSCQFHAIDTEWSDGECLVANPLKKALASMPENLYERAGANRRRAFHGGLDVTDGTLLLNARYCEAYGLDFEDGDCVASGGQSFGEFLFGVTPVRAAKTAGSVPFVPPRPPSDLPDYLFDKSAPLRTKRSSVFDEHHHDPKTKVALQELALEMTKDLGREVSEWALENFLKKKAPKFYASMLDRVAYRLVLKHSVTQSLKRFGTTALRSIGKGVGAATSVYAVYDLGVGILDILDPYDFKKVLDKKSLAEIDSGLDYLYFKDGPVRPKLTPEYVWENEILPLDESDMLNFMAEKVEEYLTALNPADETVMREFVTFDAAPFFVDRVPYFAIAFCLVCLVLVFVDWIHFWTCCVFFFLVVYRR